MPLDDFLDFLDSLLAFLQAELLALGKHGILRVLGVAASQEAIVRQLSQLLSHELCTLVHEVFLEHVLSTGPCLLGLREQCLQVFFSGRHFIIMCD